MARLTLTRREAVVGSAALLASPLLANETALSSGPDKLNFLVLGNWGRKGKPDQRKVAGQMGVVAEWSKPQFLVTTGDNFYNLGVTSVEDSHWRKSFDDIYTHGDLQIPWHPTLGNHDYGGDVQAQIDRSRHCKRWEMDGRWYKRTPVNGVDLFFIDTIVWTGGEKFPYSLLGSKVTPADQLAQRRWLENNLMLSRAPVKIVFGHYPIYSVGKHGGSMKMWDLDQLMRRADVSAYVCGHDHCTYHIEANGMHYVCSGGGAQALPDFTGESPYTNCVIPGDCKDLPDELSRPRLVKHKLETGFALFSVSASGFHARLYDGTGGCYHGITTGPVVMAA